MAKIIYKEGFEGQNHLECIEGIEIGLENGRKALIFPKYAWRKILRKNFDLEDWDSEEMTIKQAMASDGEADYLQNFVYDRKDVDAEKWIEDVRKDPIPIPEYTFDCHTRKGKMRGRTKEEFFKEEHEALQPREPGLFDNLF